MAISVAQLEAILNISTIKVAAKMLFWHVASLLLPTDKYQIHYSISGTKSESLSDLNVEIAKPDSYYNSINSWSLYK